MASDTKYLLQESYATTKKMTGLNPSSPREFRGVLESTKAFNTYLDTLSENMSPQVKKEFKILAGNSRVHMVRKLYENSTYNITPYETLNMPLLSIFYPRLIARELVTVDPIDKPEVIKMFLQPIFTKWNDSKQYAAPSYNNISSGPNTNNKTMFPNGAAAAVPSTTNLLQLFNLNSETSHIERDLLIYQVSDGSGNTSDVQVSPDVDGNIAFTATIGSASDVVTGTIDYYSGNLVLSSSTGLVKTINFSVSTSLEENTINPYIQLVLNKIRLTVKDREISAQWTLQFEQDIKALFDIDLQAQLVTSMGQQVAMDIDREIINTLLAIANNGNLVNATHNQSFSMAAPSGYMLGNKPWFENIYPVLTMVGASIYTDTNIESGNLVACNPIDATIFMSTNGFKFEGTAADGGNVDFKTATAQGGAFKILVSPLVPQGQMLVTYKPDVELKSVFLYSPYVPAVLSPYPMINKPSMTLLSRYATAPVRPNGLGVIQITNYDKAYGQGTVAGYNGVPNPAANAWL